MIQLLARWLAAWRRYVVRRRVRRGTARLVAYRRAAERTNAPAANP